MQNTDVTDLSKKLNRLSVVFLSLVILAMMMYSYNSISNYLNGKRDAIINISDSLEKRIDNYRFVTYQIHERFSDRQPLNKSDATEIPLENTQAYYVKSHGNRANAIILGQHNQNTLNLTDNLANYFELAWGALTQNYTLFYIEGDNKNSAIMLTTQPLKEIATGVKSQALANLIEQRRDEILADDGFDHIKERFDSLRKSRFENSYIFTLRTQFNRLNKAPTIITFDMPIDDLVPMNFKRRYFNLEHDDIDLNKVTPETIDSYNSGSTINMNNGHVEIRSSLSNAPLTLTYNISLAALFFEIINNNILLILLNIAVIVLTLYAISQIRRHYFKPTKELTALVDTLQTLSDDLISHLPIGVLTYNFANSRLIHSNQPALKVLPHINLRNIIEMSKDHNGAIQVTVNESIYQIMTIKSQLDNDTYIFLITNQGKELMLGQRLQQAKADSETLIKTRQVMLSHLSQELQQPIQKLLTVVEQLEVEKDTPQCTYLQSQLTQHADDLNTLLDNVVMLSQLEQNEWQGDIAPFKPADLIDDMVLSLLPAINRKALHLFSHVALPHDHIYLGDTLALGHLIRLLITNAISTTDLGKITLNLSTKDETPNLLILDIRDTGRGLSRQERENLTHPLLHKVQSDRFHYASGLTLFLCQQLAKQLNGTLKIDNVEGVGTRYLVTMQLDVEMALKDEEDERLLEDCVVLLDIASKEVRDITCALLHVYGARYLFVDDENRKKEQHDILITDKPNITDRYTLLLTNDELGIFALQPNYIRGNYNISSSVIDAVLQLMERKFAESENNSPKNEAALSELDDLNIEQYKKALKKSDYYPLFIQSVPADIETLYRELSRGDLTALAQTAHRLKGAFAMLGLTPGKVLCEALEDFIASEDTFNTEKHVSLIDAFVKRLL